MAAPLAGGAAALASAVGFDLERLWREEAAEQKQLYLEWKEKDKEFRKIEKQWREIECKRFYADEKSKQLAMLAELGAWIGGFQMMMLYEQEFPPLTEHVYSHVLLVVWGLSCVGVSCVMMYIMVVASIINFEVVEASGREELEKDYDVDLQYRSDENGRSEADGLIVNAKQFADLWQVTVAAHLVLRGTCFRTDAAIPGQHRYDRTFRTMVLSFSYCMPLFFANVAMSAFVKFYMALPPATVGFLLAAVGSSYWLRVHTSIVAHLVWREGSDCHLPGA